MPDTRKKHPYPGPLPGFKPGQLRQNESGNQGSATIDGVAYSQIHVTVEGTSTTGVTYQKAPGQKKGKGQKIQHFMVDHFHVSLYRPDGSRATGFYWSFDSSVDAYVALGWQEDKPLPWTTVAGSQLAVQVVTNRAQRRHGVFGSTIQAATLTKK